MRADLIQAVFTTVLIAEKGAGNPQLLCDVLQEHLVVTRNAQRSRQPFTDELAAAAILTRNGYDHVFVHMHHPFALLYHFLWFLRQNAHRFAKAPVSFFPLSCG